MSQTETLQDKEFSSNYGLPDRPGFYICEKREPGNGEDIVRYYISDWECHRVRSNRPLTLPSTIFLQRMTTNRTQSSATKPTLSKTKTQRGTKKGHTKGQTQLSDPVPMVRNGLKKDVHVRIALMSAVKPVGTSTRWDTEDDIVGA